MVPLGPIQRTKVFLPTRFKQWAIVLAFFSILTLTFGYIRTRAVFDDSARQREGSSFPIPSPLRESSESSGSWDVLNYPFPTDTFRENLHPNQHYVTGWVTGGFTNEYLSYIHLIYLGFISGRIPIVPPFVPHDHIPWTTPPIDFGVVYNLTALQSYLKRPILEWSQVKRIGRPESLITKDFSYKNNYSESLGCWSTRSRHEPRPAECPRAHELLGLDVSYTRVPDFAYRFPDIKVSADVTFSALAATIAPRRPYPVGDLPLMATSPSGSALPPDAHLACHDHLYYATSGVDSYEWKYSWSPEWRTVGMNLPFTQNFVDLAKEYLERVFHEEVGTSSSGELPPAPMALSTLPVLITVHIRRGDFADQCFSDKPCRIGTEKFAQAVGEVKKLLATERGVEVGGVFVASDEEGNGFWEEIRDLGWKHINHTSEKTRERFGEWIPAIIDTVVLSLGVGFVGTLDSTFSTLSARRVEDWNDGIVRLVHRHLDET